MHFKHCNLLCCFLQNNTIIIWVIITEFFFSKSEWCLTIVECLLEEYMTLEVPCDFFVIIIIIIIIIILIQLWCQKRKFILISIKSNHCCLASRNRLIFGLICVHSLSKRRFQRIAVGFKELPAFAL